TAISLFSPDKTMDFGSNFNCAKSSSIISSVNGSSAKTSILEPLVKSIPGFNFKNVRESTPKTTKLVVAIKIFLRCLTILGERLKIVGSTSSSVSRSWICDGFTPNQPFRLVKRPLSTHKPRSNLVPYTAVKKLTNILTINIVANPLTELVPKIKSTLAAKRVVMFASKIVTKEFLPPDLKEFRTDFLRRS